MKLKAYKVELSNGSKIPIDADELPNVIQAIQSGRPAIVRQGIFNPSYYVAIVEDVKRITEVQEANYRDRFSIENGDTQPHSLKPIANIFEEVDFTGRKQLKANDK